MSEQKKRVFGLDAMRTFASILVLVSHGALLFPGYNNVLTDSLQILGVFGVEMFFILSGFLIGGILIDLLKTTKFNLSTLKYFWIRRWFRTIPLYFLLLILNILLVYLFNNPLPKQLWKYFFFLQNFIEKQSFFFRESWSLTIEEYSYLLAPLLILLCSLIIKDKVKSFLFATVSAILFFIGVKINYYLVNLSSLENLIHWNSNLKGVLIYRLDTIFYGFLAAYLYKVKREYFYSKKNQLLFLGLVLFGLIYGTMLVSKFQMEGFKFFWNVIYLPLNSLAIAFCIPYIYYLSKPFKLLENWIEKISIYSYSIYLIHYSIVLTLLTNFLPIKNYSIYQKFILFIIYLIITYLLSFVSYKYFEKPMMDIRDKPFFRKKQNVNLLK